MALLRRWHRYEQLRESFADGVHGSVSFAVIVLDRGEFARAQPERRSVPGA